MSLRLRQTLRRRLFTCYDCCPPESVAVIAAGHDRSRLGRPLPDRVPAAEMKVARVGTLRETVHLHSMGLVEGDEAKGPSQRSLV